MSAVDLRALSVGYLAAQRLNAAADGTLRIHSMFRQTLNLQLGDGMLLPLISASSSGNHPDALRVLVPADWDWRHSAEIRLTHSMFEARDWQCAVSGLPVWRSVIPSIDAIPLSVLPFLHMQLREWCQQQSIVSILQLLPDDVSGVPVEISPDDSADKLAAMADRIIGLGGGLTPDGDDYLLGYFAALSLAPAGQIALHRQRLAAVVDARLTRTNDISRHYLGRAAQGHFSESLCRLMAQLAAPFCPTALAKCATDVMAFGASSGADCMAGFLHGLRHLAAA
jgi:hypothetical protein